MTTSNNTEATAPSSLYSPGGRQHHVGWKRFVPSRRCWCSSTVSAYCASTVCIKRMIERCSVRTDIHGSVV